MRYEIEQCLRFEVKPMIEFNQIDMSNGLNPRAAGSVSPFEADRNALVLRYNAVRRSLAKAVDSGSLQRREPRDIVIGNMLVLKNCTQILSVNEREHDIEIRFMQVISDAG
jgi:hypothetical protein